MKEEDYKNQLGDLLVDLEADKEKFAEIQGKFRDAASRDEKLAILANLMANPNELPTIIGDLAKLDPNARTTITITTTIATTVW